MHLLFSKKKNIAEHIDETKCNEIIRRMQQVGNWMFIWICLCLMVLHFRSLCFVLLICLTYVRVCVDACFVYKICYENRWYSFFIGDIKQCFETLSMDNCVWYYYLMALKSSNYFSHVARMQFIYPIRQILIS